jgi:hypothetical protein
VAVAISARALQLFLVQLELALQQFSFVLVHPMHFWQFQHTTAHVKECLSVRAQRLQVLCVAIGAAQQAALPHSEALRIALCR